MTEKQIGKVQKVIEPKPTEEQFKAAWLDAVRSEYDATDKLEDILSIEAVWQLKKNTDQLKRIADRLQTMGGC